MSASGIVKYKPLYQFVFGAVFCYIVILINDFFEYKNNLESVVKTCLIGGSLQIGDEFYLVTKPYPTGVKANGET